MKKITLKDVAEKAGVSSQTVSQVLNNKPKWVGAETRDRVRRIARELNYSPNAMARSLRSSKSQCIGVVFSSRLQSINDVFESDILSGIGAAIDASDYGMHLFSSYRNIRENALNAVRGRQVDGLIFIIYSKTYAVYHDEIAPEMAKVQAPCYGIQMFSEYRDPHCTCYRVGDAAAMAVRHLHGNGCGTVGLLTHLPAESASIREQLAGFRNATDELGITGTDIIRAASYRPAETPVPGSRYDTGYAAACDLTDRGRLRDGYVVYSDVMAAGFRDALAERGIRVPGDVALVGHGNELTKERGSDFFTTIDPGRAEMGRTAARMLIERLEHQNAVTTETPVFFNPRLIIRKSCGKNS